MFEDTDLTGCILDQLSEALIYVDRNGTIRLWNRAAIALFGYDAFDMIGQNLDRIIPAHLRAAHYHGFNAAMSSGFAKLDGKAALTRAAHKDGRKLYVEMSFAVVKGGHPMSVQGAVAVARNVTKRVDSSRIAS